MPWQLELDTQARCWYCCWLSNLQGARRMHGDRACAYRLDIYNIDHAWCHSGLLNVFWSPPHWLMPILSGQNALFFVGLLAVEGHSNCMAFNVSTPGLLLAVMIQQPACVWNTSDTSCLSISNHLENVKSLCATDFCSVITGTHCSCGQLKSWSVDTGEALLDFVGHTHALLWCACCQLIFWLAQETEQFVCGTVKR